ncbi:MAG: hypothetical protein LBV13_03175, partial [Methanomassiliicoccaceae archaeon]|nr:hypothetical protein [Methanomassiliicoccaceae archaeon]
MTVRLQLRITYPSRKAAETVLRSLEPDNTGYVSSSMNNNELIFTIEADNAGTLRNAADDLLACVKVIEEA